jgi:Fic family protein
MNDFVNSETWQAGSLRRTLEGYEAFYPNALPLSLDYPEDIVPVLTDATAAVHRLAGASRLLPTPEILIGPYVRIEAILSSRIEGTQATVGELLEFEGAGEDVEPKGDLQEVVNYVNAFNHAISRLPELPLSSRLIREAHAILMANVRGEYATPGEFRTSQNWIGPPGATLAKASFVPPPHEELADAMKQLETFVQDRSLPNLIAIGLAHYQFETIHPFLDGNGRIGRLLIILMMIERGILDEPALYLSAFFEQRRNEYYELLDVTRQTSDVFPWLRFFLIGVTTMAKEAEERAVRLTDLQRQLRTQLLEGGGTQTVVRLAERLLDLPYVTASRIARELGVSFPTAQRAIDDLVAAGILEEITGQRRNRVYLSRGVMDVVYGGLH